MYSMTRTSANLQNDGFFTPRHCTKAKYTVHERALYFNSVAASVRMGRTLKHDLEGFNVVGTLVRDVHGMKRAGRILGCDVLCNRLCFSDAECEHDLRLLPCKVGVSATCAEHELVAELLLHDTPSDSPAEEWMYTIGNSE